MNSLVQSFQQYSGWRSSVSQALVQYRAAASAAGLLDPALARRLDLANARLSEDKLVVAFVAEFSRGKSELINAIFFAGYGRRILPSSAGRTTMCPTELMYDETLPPSIRLLPIETRAQPESTSDLRARPEAWEVAPLDIASSDGMLEAFRQVSTTKRVSVEDARRYGLYRDDDPDMAQAVGADGMVDISRWRHAIVNFPHPLLRQGLVIVDTPGLNAIGTEPELTLNLIPGADAVLFVVGADTGVTRSDAEVWRQHVGAGPGRLVVMNKVDSLWDELRTPEQVGQQIASQLHSVAQGLSVRPAQVFPVSAKKGLVARINDDPALLARSGIPALEAALSSELIPARQEIARSRMQPDLAAIRELREALLGGRIRSIREQLMDLKSLRGKNQNIVHHMMARIDLERGEFDQSLVKLHGTRAVFSRLSAEVFQHLGMEVIKGEIVAVREAMDRSIFSAGMRDAVRNFFDIATGNLTAAAEKIDEISNMMLVMYRRFSAEHGMVLAAPMAFSMQAYVGQIRAAEAIYQKQFSPTAMLTTSQVVLMQQFFDSIASRVKHTYLLANRDLEAWLKVVMTPLEAQMREHRKQLKQRRLSVARIHAASDDLEEKIQALDVMQQQVQQQVRSLEAAEHALELAIASDLAPLRNAA
ncbi:dynamin family protein [Lacisediminimonas sp.]|uniref:dynamin family protein n=1 Tax=Lacisediminimonas sp. TaxID=3060582 RepID=UPI00271C1318|nr:dynamin family protein [Lacisediminimonas sp.]MDO8298660.1 dynamin family protein [Lacisediminimonas sp.]